MYSKRDIDKAQVRNKAAAPMQITAEQILREALDRQSEERGPSKVTIASEAELDAYRMSKRKEFEDQLRRQRNHMGTWIKYALWEANQQEFRRARSIFERALQVDYQNVSLWLKYIETEISSKFIQHARTLYDRVTALLPRVDQFWYKYAYMEERLENYAGARAIYEKWMGWKPTDNAWLQYAKFEERCGETDRARSVYERYIEQVQSELAFVRYCKFEERQREFEKARAGYETCIQLLSSVTEDVFLKYARFEMRRKDGKDRVVRVFKQGLTKLAPENCKALYAEFVSFTKETGSKDEIEQLLIEKRRIHYEREMAMNPDNLDIGFNYTRMEEQAGELERAREVYERCLAKISLSKVSMDRYIFFWLYYAQFEESIVKDVSRAKLVLETAISVFEPLGIFSSKIYVALGHLELRQSGVAAFRKILTRALDVTKGAKLSIARAWVETELKLGNVNQARSVAASLISLCPTSTRNWIFFIDLELALGEPQRAIALCEMAIRPNIIESLDAPELVYKKLIEIDDTNDPDRVRELFKDLLNHSEHPKIFLAYADYEVETNEDIERACAILEGGLDMVTDKGVLQNRLDELQSKIE
jgi:crooked neck